MVHLMNELAPDACVPGNHEFDFSRERFNQLVESCNFPWVLSNAEEQTKDGWATLKYLHRYTVLEAGPDEQKLRIGIIGLISADTVSKTNSQARGTFRLCEPNSNENEEMKKKCMKLAAELRGEPEKCDLVFALTHGVFDEDIDLGKHANCYTVGDFSSLGKGVLKDTPGIDLILGGHDHEYFLGKGVKLIETTFPQGKREPPKTQGALDNDDGLLLIKSGTDFQDLSEIEITVEEGNEQVRRKVIKSVEVKRHCYPDTTRKVLAKDSQKDRMGDLLRRIFKYQVGSEMKKPVAQLPPEILPSALANGSQESRQGETILGNWIADSMIRWYKNHRTENMKPLSDLIFVMGGGSIRTGLDVDPKRVTQGDIVSLNPFITSLVTFKITGKALWEAFEQALRESVKTSPSTHKAFGGFPVVSGIKVEWDSTEPKGKRVRTLTLSSGVAVEQDTEHFYNILTDSYLANGGDDLTALKEHTEYVDSEIPVYRALLTDIGEF
ncbi:unnamed protein product [Rhizoctonia solani]|uniref:5'-nucleotidase n=1 Tax=Rhizoctonia solani TaxID=456999 RepID=A0A8H3CPW7_9AGAM|nr:unnamed protein product [Rhizoctonia solani]